MSALHVRMENPETGGVWDCPVDYLPVAKARGWVESDKPLPGEELEYPAAPVEEVDEAAAAVLLASQSPFDPAAHTVAEVQEYLDTHADSPPGEGDRVLEAERAGKNRVTLTGDTDEADDEADDGE
jgi:hypothetical protein